MDSGGYEKQEYSDWAYRINYKAILSPDTLFEAVFGQVRMLIDKQPLSGDWDNPAYYYYDIGLYTNNQDGNRIDKQKRTDFTARLTQYLETESFGNHELGVGFSYQYTYGEDGQNWTGLAYDNWPGEGEE